MKKFLTMTRIYLIILMIVRIIIAAPAPIIKNVIFDVDEVLLNHDKKGEKTIPPQMLSLIKHLKTEKYRLFILSNMYPATYHYLSNSTELLTFFEGVHCCRTIGTLKPKPQSFTKLLKNYKLAPEQCLFIDDRLKNVIAARNLGIISIHFISPDQCYAELKKIGITTPGLQQQNVSNIMLAVT